MKTSAYLRLTRTDGESQDIGVIFVERKRGRFTVRCPFHEERSPSLLGRMREGEELGSFHCLGCGAEGEISIIMEFPQDDPEHKAILERIANLFTRYPEGVIRERFTKLLESLRLIN